MKKIDSVPYSSWFAISVRSNHESVVGTMLEHKDYKVFVPTYRHRTKWSDRVKELTKPLFPGYLFCRFDPSVKTAAVVTTPGVIRIIGFGSTPVAVDDAEIEALQKVVASGLDVSPWPQYQPGSSFRISCGALAGVQGTLLTVKNRNELILSISLLQRSVAVCIDSALCEQQRVA